MERLRERDLEASLSYLRGLYAQGDPEGFKRHVLATITSLIPSDLTTYNELYLRTSRNVWEWEPIPSDFAELTEVFAIYMDENPCVDYYRRTGDGESLGVLGLTDREAEILLGVARGKTNREIAAGLYVSPLTVKTHLQHVYRKLGVESRTEALSRALERLGILG